MPGHFHLARVGGLGSPANLGQQPFLAPAAIGILWIFLLAAVPALADGGATITPVAEGGPAFYCGESKDVTFGYVPDTVDTPVLRAYSVRIIAPYGLDFDQGDILVYSPLDGVTDTHIIVENDVNDYNIDFTFLDPGAGLTEPADLFTITVHDREFNIPNTQVGIDSGRFRNPGNQDITVDFSATAEVDVICVAPPRPTVNPEPEYTPGTTNTISWEDDSWGGAVEYKVVMSTDSEFAAIDDESAWIPGLSHTFIDLVDGQEYFFKANSRNFTDKVSFDSNVVSTIQDAVAPTTSADPLDPDQYLTEIAISFQADDAGSGFDQLELFYRFDGGPWTSYGNYAVSPIPFAATDGDGLYDFYTVGTDVAGNVETTPTGPQASTTLDTSEPFGFFVVNADSVATKNPDVKLTVTVVRALEMRFRNNDDAWGAWVPLASEHSWTIPTTEQIHTVHGQFRDGIMQVMPASDTIEFDITPPGGVISPSASPSHEAVFLTWTNPADPDFHRVEVWRALLHDGSLGSTYPSYDGSTVPIPPLDRAAAFANPEWEQAGLSDIGTAYFIDSVPARGIYYYRFFAMDEATNFSDPGGELPRSTNYILGDIAQPNDGLVNAEDFSVLGSAYCLFDSDPLFLGEADVAPTDDGTGTGIPEPDDQIDYEDYLIFSMNYAPLPTNPAREGILPRATGPVSLAWRPAGDNTWALDLVAPYPRLKGVGLGAALPQGIVPVVAPGEAVTSQADPFFLEIDECRDLIAALVILGTDRGMTSTGTLFTVELPAGVDPAILDSHNITLDLRDLNNQPLEFDLQGKSASDTPAIFFLGDAYPNPFNPVTTINFNIPGEMHVRLAIYGMDGRRIAVLVDETLVAGPHEAVWRGRDETGRPVGSGVYFSKLLAGSQSQVRKMTLMK
jgi:hypothetical protein